MTFLGLAQLAFAHSSQLHSSLLNGTIGGPLASVLPNAQQAAPLAAGALIAAAWQGAILVTLVALTLRLVPRLSATIRSLVWTAVLAIAVLLPLLSLTSHSRPTDAIAQHTTLHLAEGWSFALAALWAAISLFKLSQLARSAWHLSAISHRSVEVDPTELATFAPQAAALLHQGWRRPLLCISDEVDRPSVAGFFSPRILLPIGLLEHMTPLELEQILRHEREHLNRADDWVNLAQKLALALFPLNPALLFIERQLSNERELACDDTVLRETQATPSAAKSYALCLANLAEISLAKRTAMLALAAWQKRSELTRRVERILLPRAVAMPRHAAATVGTLVTLLAVGSAATLAHAPALISFVPASSNTLAAENIAAKSLAPTRSLRALDETMLPTATNVSANQQTQRRAHAVPLVMTFPARPQAVPASFTLRRKTAIATQPKPVFRAIEAAEVTMPDERKPVPSATATLYRQVIATTGDGVTSITTFSSWEVTTSRPQATTPQPQQNAPRQPHYVPAYAIMTPNGLLVLEM